MESSLFKVETPEIGSSVGGLAQFLKPLNDTTAVVDVRSNYEWTLSPSPSRVETPYIVLLEWRVLRSSLETSARYYATGAAQQVTGSKNPWLQYMRGYSGLFDFDSPTGFQYIFPFFSDISTEVTSSWTTLDVLEKLKNAIGFVSPKAAELAEIGTNLARTGYEANYPRVGIMDRPKLWQESSFRSISIKFPLYNTKSVDDIKKNWELCYLLTYQNMFNKRDFITALPPVFYTVFAPGQFFSLGAYVSDLKIYNKGNIRFMNVFGGSRKYNIPDAYEVNITLTDMIMPSQNMMSVVGQGITPVQVNNIADINRTSDEE